MCCGWSFNELAAHVQTWNDNRQGQWNTIYELRRFFFHILFQYEYKSVLILIQLDLNVFGLIETMTSQFESK